MTESGEIFVVLRNRGKGKRNLVTPLSPKDCADIVTAFSWLPNLHNEKIDRIMRLFERLSNVTENKE